MTNGTAGTYWEAELERLLPDPYILNGYGQTDCPRCDAGVCCYEPDLVTADDVGGTFECDNCGTFSARELVATLTAEAQAPARQQPPTAGEIRRDLEALPSDWSLCRVGPDKAPIGGKGWYDNDRHSPDHAASLNGSSAPTWGLLCGEASGALVLDLDADGWRESFQLVTGHPITDLPRTISWSSGKPGRSGHAFTVPLEWWPSLRNRAYWDRPWRDGERPPGAKADATTTWELRWTGHQSVIIGAHPETGRYSWLEGCSPHDIPDPAEAPEWLLEHLLIQEHPQAAPVEPTADDAARAVEMLKCIPAAAHSSYSEWLRVGMALHHTDPGLLTAWVDWCRPMATFDEAECLRKWEGFGKGHKGRSATIATLHYLAKQHGYREPMRQRSATKAKPRTASPQPPTSPRQATRPRTPTHAPRGHYIPLGWDSDRSVIWYQSSATGQVARITPTGRTAILRLAPIRHWELAFPGDRAGIEWDAALSHVIEQADRAGVFEPAALRGRGIWRDGDRTVWHLGDRLDVDGRIVDLIDHQSTFRYARLPALSVNPATAPLTDQQGWQITDSVAAMGWGTTTDHLTVLGWTVCAIAGGAIPHRPGLQITSRSGSGKSTITRLLWAPLFAGAALLRSGSTEAGIRQLAGPDALPVVVDETEAGEARGRREGMLRLMRHSYDGTPLDKGTTHGRAISYPVKFAMALLAVNGSVALATDANRLATASRSPVPLEQWHRAEQRLQDLVTPAAGAALHRRIVDNLPALLANINAFHRAVEQLAPAGIEGRTADTYAPLLAGAHLLISTDRLDDVQASAWLVHAGWGAGALGNAADNRADAEGRQLLELILAHEIQWREPGGEQGSGRRSIGTLIDMARHEPAASSGPAVEALAERGLKVWASGLLVTATPAPLAPILNGTRWADGGHTARLRDLPGAETGKKERIMRGCHPVRTTFMPWGLVDGTGFSPA